MRGEDDVWLVISLSVPVSPIYFLTEFDKSREEEEDGGRTLFII